MSKVFDRQKIRQDFPMLQGHMNGHALVYLDNAATTQKPEVVIERMNRFLRQENANIHRGVYTLSQEATARVEETRENCAQFINAKKSSEIIFTRGATEAINLVACGFGRKFLKPGDEIVISTLEHHSNIVPWQALCEEKKASLKVIPVTDSGELDLAAFERLLSERTRLVAVTQVSNALGTVLPIRQLIAPAHRVGAWVLIDGSQGVPHLPVDVQALDCDFYCFSGHKLYGPTGIGVLYGKESRLEAMDPYQFGGDMIESVSFEKTTYAKPPAKFEAGTPAIAEILGLGAALDYLQGVGMDNIQKAEKELLTLATGKLSSIRGLRILGTAKEKASLISFTLDGIHPHDVGTVLNEWGIAVRAGHHCAQPTMKRFGVPATTRASFSFYNTEEEIDLLARGIHKVLAVFQ